MARFFVEQRELVNDRITLTGENAAHAKVLRIKTGETVTVSDGRGTECTCTVVETSFEQVTLAVTNRYLSDSEASVNVSVYMAYSKGDKLEHVIQKATELGAYEIVAFPSSRCVSKPDEKSIKKKLERWQKIAASASEQSGRGRIPAVRAVSSYANAVADAAKADIGILFYENEHATTLRMALNGSAYRSVSLMTGPEGGFETWEVEQAVTGGLKVCTLGKRILRCETAPLCALSAVMYDSGEF